MSAELPMPKGMGEIGGAAKPSVDEAGSAAQSPANSDATSSEPMSGATQLKSRAGSAEQPALLTTHEIKLDNLRAIFANRDKETHVQKLLSDVAALRAWQAVRNTDYHITKCGTKALEQPQNLIAQFAIGLRHLELEEEQEQGAGDAAVLQNLEAYKQRARRVTLRLAMAANRATWASCCRMALFIRTLAHVRKTYFPEISTSAGWHIFATHASASCATKMTSSSKFPTSYAREQPICPH